MARTAIHPGEHLAEELKELGISAAELARQIDVPVNRVTGIINVSERSRPTPRCGSATGTALAPNFGLIFKSFMSCAWREKNGARVEKLPKLTQRRRIKARQAA